MVSILIAAWSADGVERFVAPPDTTFGPGYYDITAYERSRWGPCPKAVKFNDVPRAMADAFEEAVDLSHLADTGLEKRPFSCSIKAAYRAGRNRQRAQSASAPSRSSEHGEREEAARDHTAGSAVSSAEKGVKFSSIDRWFDPLQRPEVYVKTTGMTLDPDFDRVLNKRRDGPFASTARFESVTPAQNLAPLFLDALPYNAPTLEYSSLRSPINYSAFRSKEPVGLQIISSTSGEIGPMHYPGAFESSVAVREPHKNSRAFLNPQGGGLSIGIQAAPDVPYRVLSFSEANPQGPLFAPCEPSVGLRSMVREKVGKIYPRLARRMGIGR